jgi:hypothetical protein
VKAQCEFTITTEGGSDFLWYLDYKNTFYFYNFLILYTRSI